MTRSKQGVVLVAGMAILLSSPVSGQEQPDSAVLLAPIMVRVLQSTIGTSDPYPVSIAAGPELTRGAASAFLEEALRAVPGLQIQNRFNFAVGERLAMRGFGPRAQFGIRGIRILVDGIPATLPDGQATLDHLDLSGLDRVEALRGPNATLYGNAAGGVLHFRTRAPARQGITGTLRSSLGSHGLLSWEGSVSGTSGDVGYRAGFTRLTYDGYRRDPEADDGSAYGAATRSVFNGTLMIPVGAGSLRVVANGVDLDAENPGSLPADGLAEGQRAAWGFNVRSGTGKEVRQGQVGVNWTTGIAGGDLEAAVWSIRRELENPIPGRVVGVSRTANGLRAVFRASRSVEPGTLSFGIGAEAEAQNDDRQNWDNNGGDKGTLILDQQENVRGAGLFLQGRLDLPAGVSFLTGIRYDRIRFEADDRFTAGGDPDDSGERTMDQFSPSAGILVEVRPDFELFGSAALSFETPTTTELANRPSGAGGINPDLDPQTGLTVEGGARGRFGGSWSAEATLFRTDLAGGLISFEVPSDPGRSYFRNTGETSHSGWEVSVDGEFREGVGLRVAYTRIDARFDAYVNDDGDDFSGNRIPGLAPYRVDVLGLFDRGPGFVEVRGLFQDAVPVDDAGMFESSPYFVADVRAGLSEVPFGASRVSPYVAVSNVFDRGYTSSVVVNAFGGRYFEPGPTRTFRVGVAMTFGGGDS